MHRRTILFALPLTLLALTACQKAASGPAPELKPLTVDEVETRINAHDGKTFVFDNNDKDRYSKGHLPGARWVDEDAVTAAVLPPDKGVTLIFYCANEL